MLDLHAVSGTPGAATVLGSNFATIPTLDGQSVAGVPISPGAALVGWGGLSPTADTVGALKLQSQDMVDPINGENFTPGAASLLNGWWKYTNLPYSTGLRGITMGTNTGVVASLGLLLDEYMADAPTINGSRNMPNQITTGITTFGGALTTLVWGSQPYAPGTALPNGKYAILGAYVSAIANLAAIRFQHVDFRQYLPGFPVANYETISTSTWDKVPKDDLFQNNGFQFVFLSDVMNVPCCPVFSVTNAGTGLNIQAISVQADTPVVMLNLAKVG